MTTEDRLRESLHRRAEAIRVAPDAWTQIAAPSEPRRRTRRFVAIAVAVPVAAALVIAALTITTGGHDQQVRVVDSGPVPHTDVWVLNSVPTPHADLIDAATGAKRSIALAGLSPDLRIQHAVRRGNVLVVDQAFGSRPANVFVVNPDGSSRPLSEGSAAFPSASEDRVWVVSRDATTVREVDLAGHETISPHRLPPGYLVVGAVDDGLVGNEQAPPNGPIASVSVWDPVNNAIVRRWPGWFVAGRGRTVVWSDHGGQVHLTDVRTGVEKVAGPEERLSSVGGIGISPDGRTVALLGEGHNDFTFALVDVPSARVTHIAGWQGQDFGGVGWSADSSWVYFAGARHDHDPFQLFAVRRGASKVTPLRVTVQSFETATVGPGF
jgi:hypothetical protein